MVVWRLYCPAIDISLQNLVQEIHGCVETSPAPLHSLTRRGFKKYMVVWRPVLEKYWLCIIYVCSRNTWLCGDKSFP